MCIRDSFDSYYFGNNKPQAANFGNTLEIYPNPAINELNYTCLLYTSDAADERSSVDLGGRRIIKKKKPLQNVEYIIIA